MNFKKGEIWWTDLDEPRGSEPGYRRPVVIVQSDDFNKSKIKTVIVAIITSNLKLAKAPGNIKLGATKNIGLKKESVINVSQVITLDKSYLIEKTGKLSTGQRQELNDGLKLVLDI
ncbi:MAG: type II toxin-antitoxin system PemK/MazF family toxin [Proteobacteria bacterium]|nr:type II toxin-antitoxin system PemK/MazF family toxin [Pseudomonadota bacterium]